LPLVEINAVDPADKGDQLLVWREGTAQLPFLVAFCVDDAPALTCQPSLAGREGAQALPCLFKLQTDCRAALVRTVLGLYRRIKLFGQEGQDVLITNTVAQLVRFPS